MLHALIAEDPSLGEPLVAGLPYVRAEAVYAARHEMATHGRRRPGPPHPRSPAGAGGVGRRRAGDVAALMAPELGWSAEEAASQADAYVALVAAERDAPGLLEPRVEVPA